MYDCCFDQTRGWAWIEWTRTVPEYVVPKGAKFGDIFVTTVDTVQASYIIDTLITHNVPVLMAGGGTSEKDLGNFWKNMRPHFGPDPSRATTKLSDDEKKALLQIAWIREEAAGMTEARAAKT